MAREPRRLAAIVSADVAGYSRLMGADDSGTLAALKAHRQEPLTLVADTAAGSSRPRGPPAAEVSEHSRRGTLRGWRAARMAERNAGYPDKRFEVSGCINVGDIIIDGDDIHGDGVNVAAQLQALAEPGGICAAAWSETRCWTSSASRSRTSVPSRSRTSPDRSRYSGSISVTWKRKRRTAAAATGSA